MTLNASSSSGGVFRYHLGVLTSPRAHELPSSLSSTTSVDLLAKLLHVGEPALRSRPALAQHCEPGWRELTYDDLGHASAAVAGWLVDHGLAAGERVALLADPSCDWVVAFFGVLRAGGVVVPLDARLTPAELGPLWKRAAPAMAICARSLAATLDEALAGAPAGAPRAALAGARDQGTLPVSRRTGDRRANVPVLVLGPPAPGDERPCSAELVPPASSVDVARPVSDPALVVFTAGTTSAPKGVTLSFANVSYVVSEAVRAHHPGPGDVWLSVLPLSHMLELACGLLPALAGGGCFSIAGTLMPHEMVAALRDRRATRMVAVPLVLRLLQRPLLGGGDLGALEAVYCGGAALDPELARFFQRLGIEVYQGYGLTEMSPVVAMSRPGRNRLGSVGPPLPGTEVRILTGIEAGAEGEVLGAAEAGGEGEVLVRGPGLMLGYWGDDVLTRTVVDADGWFHTGDVGYLDDDGFLHLTGRSRELIVLDSGKKVQPEEVEAVLEASALVREVCVLGMPSPPGRHGDEVWAVVVAGDLAAAGSAGDVSHRAGERTGDLRASAGEPPGDVSEAIDAEVRRLAAALSGYKRPARVVLLPGPLPRTAKGSLRRGEVRRLLTAAGAVGR